jgi:NADH-quinone oxidoreductase subunit I
MNPVIKYFSEIAKGVGTLLTGMRVTSGYFFRPKEIITQKYPENRNTLQMFERFKGEVTMPHDENNQHACTGCGICEINCPNGSIQILTAKITNAEGKSVRAIDKHIYHLSMCTMCGLCIKTCPSDAIVFAPTFEHAVFDRHKLTIQLNKPGSSLKKGVKE